LFLVTASRMRARACDTASRLCVRAVLCGRAFLSVPPLPSTDSAAGCPALFAGFIGTTRGSDFSAPCITGFGIVPSRCGHGIGIPWRCGDLSVPVQKTYVRARVCDDAEPAGYSR
jgi:hypothetical protein